MDPILQTRACATHRHERERVGYLLFLASMVLFFAALATDLPDGLLTAATVTLIGGCVVLAPAILLGYAVKGAERDEAERGGR